MDNLIPVINKLQDVFGAIWAQSLDLPQITVVGSQSAGKSSVLENIVGRDFLPRGSGIVTRRPLVLQLYANQVDENADPSQGEEWGEFLHLPGQKFFDFSEIRAEIQRETDRVTGKNRGISNKSINLKIYSPHVLNLTLVDLPGITKVPTGDQPHDVEEQIRSMCYEFISNPNAIILAVTAANQDLANSDGLKMARSVDPDGQRTIGVLTKVDIMDQGTDCVEILNNKVIPLRKGYIAIINRSQKDIQENVSIRKGLTKEQTFFQTNPSYRAISSKCGTKNLSRTLNQILMAHIRECLPEIKATINNLLSNVQINLDSLGESIDELNNSHKGAALLRILSQFASNFRDRVDGKAASTESHSSEVTELFGGARIAYIFNEIYGKRLQQLDPLEGLSDEDIRTAIANANGTRPSLFVPEISFDVLVRKQICRLEQPGLNCLDLVMDEMQKMIGQSEVLEFNRFPDLRDRVYEVISKLLKKSLGPAQAMITNLIQMELSYINTSHPDFIGGKAAVSAAQHSRKLQNPQGVPGANGQTIDPKTIAVMGGPTNGAHPADESPRSAHTTAAHTAAQPVPNLNSPVGFFNLFQAPNKSSAATSTSRANGYMGGAGTGLNGGSKIDVIRLAQVPDVMRCSSNPTDRERVETEIIKTLITSYFEIVKKNFTDLVPKAIMHFLVFTFKENLQNELVSNLYNEQLLSDVMRESDDIAAKRKAYREMRELLHNATEIVNEVRDFKPN